MNTTDNGEMDQSVSIKIVAKKPSLFPRNSEEIDAS